MKDKKTRGREFLPESLSLENCTFSYGKNSAPVLKGINFSLSKNDFTCLVGPNGCGKSTLLKALLNSIPKMPPKERAKVAAFLPQSESPLWGYTVFETVLQGRFCHTNALDLYSKSDREIAEQTLAEFGLFDLKDKSVNEISGGEFQKVRLARCFAQRSDFLILDEPATSLDFVVSFKLMEELKQKAESHNIGVLISIHDVNLALRFAKSLALLGKYNAENNSQFFALYPLLCRGGNAPLVSADGACLIDGVCLADGVSELEDAMSAAYGESVSLKERVTAGL